VDSTGFAVVKIGEGVVLTAFVVGLLVELPIALVGAAGAIEGNTGAIVGKTTGLLEVGVRVPAKITG
jgi:hypothetical protein